MVAMANLNIPERAIRQQIASAVNLIVQVTRLSDGTRKVTAISEITGMEGDVITMQDIFVFERTGIAPDGQRARAGSAPPASGRSAASGWRRRACTLPADMFEHVQAGGLRTPMIVRRRSPSSLVLRA